MSTVSTWLDSAHLYVYAKFTRYTVFPMQTNSPKPLYSGDCIDRKKGNIAITMNSRVTMASCIVVVSTFFSEGIHRHSHYRASLTRSPSH